MKHLTVVVPHTHCGLSTVACIAGIFEVFNTANSYRRRQGQGDLFSIQLAGVTPQQEVYHGMFTVNPQLAVTDILKTDLIIIPSNLLRNQNDLDKKNEALLQWITKQYKKGASVASICTGAFLLATSGLLEGKQCSTHWAYADAFRNNFPGVELQDDRLITDEHGIYTNGGAYSFLNLMIYLVEKYYDRQTAIYCSKTLQIEMDRNSQSPFSIFSGQKHHDDVMVQQAQAVIEASLDDKISVDELSARFAVGRRTFDRRFLKATGNTPLEYAQRVKIESAKKALETSRKTINEVMYEVGYSDVKAFREVFRKITGLSPLDYRRKFNREASAISS
jgi:transcriptional regulator GlxA family with amidase domain